MALRSARRDRMRLAEAQPSELDVGGSDHQVQQPASGGNFGGNSRQ
ncbi:MAG: hypothetical protein U1E51_07695 [Candidatus Binatia bacterium]|nr:hypothetical protein [Candidatus Binatia bacterium]